MQTKEKIKLRNYQIEAVNTCFKEFDNGTNRQIISIPCGTGKTVIAAEIISKAKERSNKKILFVIHRDELARQTKVTVEKFLPNVKVGIEKAEQKVRGNEDLVIASVQSLGLNSSKRIEKFNPSHFSCVIIDEAHRSVAPTYKNILNYFGIGDKDNSNKDILSIGLTATPNRADGTGLDQVYDKLTFFRTTEEMIKAGWLCNIKAYKFFTNTDLGGIKNTAGDFNQKQLEKVTNTDERNGVILAAYKELCLGEKTLVFCVSKAHAEEIHNLLKNQLNINCRFITDSTPKEERREIINNFEVGKVEDGDIECLTNILVASEGYDNASIRNIIIARPTMSPVLLTQQTGRGLRLFEGKNHCKIIDIVDNFSRLSPVSLPTLFGIHSGFDCEGKDVLEVKQMLDELQESYPELDIESFQNFAQLENVDYEEINIFHSNNENIPVSYIPEEIHEVTEFQWTKYPGGIYKINLGNEKLDEGKIKYRRIEIVGDLLGHYSATYISKDENLTVIESEKIKITDDEKSINDAIIKCDDYIKKNFESSLRLVDTKAQWREAPMSSGQRALLRKFNVKHPTDMKKGQASVLIDRMFKLFDARKKKKKKERNL